MYLMTFDLNFDLDLRHLDLSKMIYGLWPRLWPR